MDPITDDCKTISMTLIDSPQKNSRRQKKGESPTSEINKSENPLFVANGEGQNAVVQNGQMEPDNQLKLENINLQLQLESSLITIDDIKNIISKFEENYIKNSKVKPIRSKQIITQFINDQDVDVDMANFVRAFDNLKKKSQESASPNKRMQRNNSNKRVEQEIVRKNEDDSQIVVELRALVKTYKSTIDSLEKKLMDKTQQRYRSESLSESEDEQSNHSIYNPFNRSIKVGGDSSRKRGRSKKIVKTRRQLRGRPRKIIVDDQSSNSITEPRDRRLRGRPRKFFDDQSSNSITEPIEKSLGRPQKLDQSSNSVTESIEKKSRGRPRKTLIEDDHNSLSNAEPPAKKSRGRPKKSAAGDQSSDYVKESKEKDFDNVIQNSDTAEFKENNLENSSENSDKNNEEIDGDVEETKQKSLSTITEVEIKYKKKRGRPKSNVSEIVKDLPGNSFNLNNSIVKSRGRPKKNETNENVNDSM